MVESESDECQLRPSPWDAVSTTVAREGLVIQLDGLHAQDMRWLHECLLPGFQSADGRRVDWRVSLRIDPSAHRALLAAGPAVGGRSRRMFGFQGQDSGCLEWRDEPLTVLDPEIEVFYRFFSHLASVEILASKHRPSVRVALLRMVREIASRHLAHQGQAQFHAAALSHGGQGFLVCGPRRAGKTSFVTHALLDSASRFISNDRAIVAPDMADDGFMLSGMPTLVAIRQGTVDLFPGLPLARVRHWRARMTLAEALALPEFASAADKSTKLVLSPVQFCHLLGVQPAAKAPLRALLFPRVDTAIRGARLTPLARGEVAERLKAELLLPGSDALDSDRLSTGSGTSVLDLVTALSARCPGFECVLGAGAYLQQSMLSGLSSQSGRTG